MNKFDIIKQFKDEGYCLIKQPSGLPKEAEELETYKTIVNEVREELKITKSIVEDSIEYAEFPEEECIIFFDETKVNIENISKLSAFVELIGDEKSNFEDTDNVYYRGHSDTTYKLEPSIYREDNKKLLISEDRTYRDILSSKPHFFNDCDTTLERLVKMQHHGIPTRLLDLTENPLIALYFACLSNEELNGEVITFKISKDRFKYFDSDIVSVITNLAKCSYDLDISDFEYPYITNLQYEGWGFPDDKRDKKISKSFLEKKEKSFNSRLQISELVHYIREDKPYFLNRINPLHLNNYTVVVKPKMTIDRIINQSGAFVLFGIDKEKGTRSNCHIDEVDYKRRVIIIPAEYKTKILNELKMFNINKSTVFCDIDTTAKYFKEKYL